ncbi:MAG: helix-turn-helix domain-containing protein [Prevotellaceae bacterium]|jgi:transcriptional regulator with XRE-family HTH domain|nr:helix-turn-helix domain-containing protein [Prevotellaceae bacterium]
MRIKEIIKSSDTTVKEVAEKMGISQPALSRVLNGNTTVEMLERIAAALEVPITELFEQPATNKVTCPRCGQVLSVKFV